MQSVTLPAFIRSAEDLARTVTLRETTESLVLEFKKDLDAWKANEAARRKAQKETCRDIAALANHLGGCILIGVASSKLGEFSVAETFHALDDIEGRTQWITQAIRNFLVPSTITVEILPIAVEVGSILALNVAASIDLVSVWDDREHTVEYLRRNSHGKVWMNPDEALRLAIDNRRVRWLAFTAAVARADTAKPVVLAAGVARFMESGPNKPFYFARIKGALVWIASIGPEDFELRVNADNRQQCVRVPISAVRNAWVTFDGRLGLDLDFQLVWMSVNELVLDRHR